MDIIEIEPVINLLKEQFRDISICCFLYGSRASGKARPNSDWDLAIILKSQVDHKMVQERILGLVGKWKKVHAPPHSLEFISIDELKTRPLASDKNFYAKCWLAKGAKPLWGKLPKCQQPEVIETIISRSISTMRDGLFILNGRVDFINRYHLQLHALVLLQDFYPSKPIDRLSAVSEYVLSSTIKRDKSLEKLALDAAHFYDFLPQDERERLAKIVNKWLKLFKEINVPIQIIELSFPAAWCIIIKLINAKIKNTKGPKNEQS